MALAGVAVGIIEVGGRGPGSWPSRLVRGPYRVAPSHSNAEATRFPPCAPAEAETTHVHRAGSISTLGCVSVLMSASTCWEKEETMRGWIHEGAVLIALGMTRRLVVACTFLPNQSASQCPVRCCLMNHEDDKTQTPVQEVDLPSFVSKSIAISQPPRLVHKSRPKAIGPQPHTRD